MNLILWRDGQELGPYDLQTVENSIQQGDISPKMLARLDTGRDWKPLEMLIPKKTPPPPTPSPETPLPTRSAKEPKNAAARTLSYVLMSLAVPLCGLGVLKQTPEKNGLEEIAKRQAATAEFSAQGMEHIGQMAKDNATISGERSALGAVLETQAAIQDFRAEADRYNAKAEQLKADRTRLGTIFFGASVFLLVLGAVIRVYS